MAVPAAAVGVSLAERGGQAAAKALTADIVVLNGKYYREIRTREPTGKLTKKGNPAYRTVRRLEPVSIDLHINPVSVALGAAAALLLGGVGAWMLGLGIKHENPTWMWNGGSYDTQGMYDLIAQDEAELALPETTPDRKAALKAEIAALKKLMGGMTGLHKKYSIENRGRFQGVKIW